MVDVMAPADKEAGVRYRLSYPYPVTLSLLVGPASRAGPGTCQSPARLAGPTLGQDQRVRVSGRADQRQGDARRGARPGRNRRSEEARRWFRVAEESVV